MEMLDRIQTDYLRVYTVDKEIFFRLDMLFNKRGQYELTVTFLRISTEVI